LDEAAARSPDAVTGKTLPSIDSLDENSELSMFLSDKVSESIKRQALRKIFHMDKFNVCDGLDDYAEDYTGFEALGDVMTAHQRLRLEREQEKARQQALVDDEHETAEMSSPEVDASQEAVHQSELAEQAPSSPEDSANADTPTDEKDKEA
jgi:hypothetical protein